MSKDIYTLSASKIASLVKSGELSALEVTEHFFKRIDAIDPKIGAYLSTCPDRAFEKAKEIDAKKRAGKPLGKLAGVPIAMKDNIHIEGELTTCASRFLANYKAPFNAAIVERLEQEDGIILGKTNLDEFAMGSSTENSALKKTVNPWNQSCVPGGSSGGSAAAVSAGLATLSFGSDTGGSIRQPAAFCGIYGYKPTYGRVSRFGLVAFASSFDQIGPFAHTAEDIALSMEVIGGHCERDSTSAYAPNPEHTQALKSDFKGKIGVPWHFLEDLKGEAKDNFLSSLDVFKAMGVELVDINLDLLKHSLSIYYILATAEASTNLARFDGIRFGVRSPTAKTLEEVYTLSKEEGFGAEVKRRILLGTYVLSSGHTDAFYRKAQKARTLVIRQMQEAFKACDLIALPTSPFAAFEVGSIHSPLEMYLADIYTISANIAGVPAISIPSGFTKDNKPMGMQLLAPHMQDSLLFQAANTFEKKTQYNLKRPPEMDS